MSHIRHPATSLATSKLTGIERINLTGSGDNTLDLAALDLFDLSDTTNQLTVIGNAGDAVDLVGVWDDEGVNGAFHTYTHGAATILVDTDVALFFV